MTSAAFALSLEALFLVVAVCGLGLVAQLIRWRARLLSLIKQRDDASLAVEVAAVAADLGETKGRPKGRRRAETDPGA